MKKILFAFITLAVIVTLSNSCKKKASTSFTFAFYNIENLFDTINDPNINDESFLPDSKVAWTSERYDDKIYNISKVLKSLKQPFFPAVVGLCEVENIDVINDLISHSNINNAGYKIVHKNSPDERGIDVALLYNPDIFHPVKNSFIVPDFDNLDVNATRDILYSKGVVNQKDTIHIFVNHWVSRWGGQEKTEPFRIAIAKHIKRITDSILSITPDANILIAGDLNDNPDDKSIIEYLSAKEVDNEISNDNLYNLSLKLYKSDTVGSLYYKSWDIFDQIIVSGAMLTGDNNLKVTSENETIFKRDWMLYQPKKGPARPSRTASGGRYYGGYSDHLPVMIDINTFE